jgi:hypothetical protein
LSLIDKSELLTIIPSDYAFPLTYVYNYLLEHSGNIYVKYRVEIGFGDMDWIHLAQDRDRRRALVNTVMNLWVP